MLKSVRICSGDLPLIIFLEDVSVDHRESHKATYATCDEDQQASRVDNREKLTVLQPTSLRWKVDISTSREGWNWQ